jgi:hypothetical protein
MMRSAVRTGRILRSLVIPLAAGAAVLLGCQTPMPGTSEEMSPAEYFQAARDAIGVGNYQAAMDYYRVYLERFPAAAHPDDLERNLWAEYEIAFMHHKLDDDQTALELLSLLVARYDGEGGEDLPPAPGRMARRVIEELQTTEG